MSNVYMAQIYINNIDALKSYMNKLDPNLKYYDIEKIKEKLTDMIDKVSFQLKDLSLSLEYKSVFGDHKNIINVIKGYLKTYDTLEQIITIKPFVDMLRTDNIDGLRTYDLTRDADNHRYNDRERLNLPISYSSDLYNTIKNMNGLNIFMPNCLDGLTLSQFAREKDKTYGNTPNYITQAKERLTRVIKGELKGSHITNNYFDVVHLMPAVTYYLQTDPFGKIMEPNEKVFVKNCIKYCRQNGVLIITLPATRVDASFAFYLSKILSNDILITKVPNDSLERITIIGQKQITNKSKPEVYAKLKYINYDEVPNSETLTPTFSIPTEELTLDFFRGSTLDVDDVLEATQTNLVSSFLESQTQPLVVKDQSPLLPFNIGQVGLVLTSGCLDGIVEEIDGVYHVIKGMTTKLTTTQTEVSEENDKVKSTETISNQVKINIFTADGKFISLG